MRQLFLPHLLYYTPGICFLPQVAITHTNGLISNSITQLKDQLSYKLTRKTHIKILSHTHIDYIGYICIELTYKSLCL